MKILDLDEYKPTAKNYMINLKNIFNKYGEQFIIKFNNNEFKVNVEPIFSFYNKEYLYGYSIKCDMSPKMQIYNYLTFMINISRERVYIANIRKTQDISGSNVVKTVLKFLKLINVKKAYLYDAAHIVCGDKFAYSLSFMQTLKETQTFYKKFGFICMHEEFSFGKDTKLRDKLIKQTVAKIKNITIDQVLDMFNNFNKFYKKNKPVFGNIILFRIIDEGNEKIEYNMYPPQTAELLRDIKSIVALLKKYEKDYKYIYELTALECEEYSILNTISEGYRYYEGTIANKTKNETFKFEHFIPFQELKKLICTEYYIDL